MYKLLIAAAMDLTDNITSSPKLTRLRVPRQLSGASVGSTFSQGKMSRMSSIRGTIRNTVRRKKNPVNKIFLKRNEFLLYSTKHIKELETALEYFRDGFKSIMQFSYQEDETGKIIYFLVFIPFLNLPLLV